MSSIQREQEIADLENESLALMKSLNDLQIAQAKIQRERLEYELKISQLKVDLKDLEDPIRTAKLAIREKEVEIKEATRKFWRAKKSGV